MRRLEKAIAQVTKQCENNGNVNSLFQQVILNVTKDCINTGTVARGVAHPFLPVEAQAAVAKKVGGGTNGCIVLPVSVGLLSFGLLRLSCLAVSGFASSGRRNHGESSKFSSII